MLTSYLPIGHRPSDNERERKLKSIFALVMIGCALLALDYMLLRPRSSLELGLDLFLLVAILGALATLQATKRLDRAFLLFACLVIPGEAGLVLLSGNREGDLLVFVLIPVWAIALLGPRRSIPWFVICVVAVVAVAAADPFLPRLASSLNETPGNPDGWLFHGPDKEPIGPGKASSYFAATVLIYLMMFTAYRTIHNANARIEALLLNILPPSIAARLRERDERNIPETGAAIADEFDQATILFADIVGFSGLAARTSAAELLTILDRVFAAFDALATKHEVEKIKTIGDAYMAVCGLPDPNPEHARNIAELALDMIESSERLGAEQGIPISLRIGINTGPVIAGVIGRKKFIYDLWGEAVNTASRMESHGEPNTIRVGKGTYEALKERYEFEPLGEMVAKGMGRVPAWRLLGRRAGVDPAAGQPNDKSAANG